MVGQYGDDGSKDVREMSDFERMSALIDECIVMQQKADEPEGCFLRAWPLRHTEASNKIFFNFFTSAAKYIFLGRSYDAMILWGALNAQEILRQAGGPDALKRKFLEKMLDLDNRTTRK